MGIKLEELVENKIKEKVVSLGFEIEYVENVKEAGQNIISVVLDKENSIVSIDDCELVSRSIEDIVDLLIDNEYVLEVSSPGLERQLKNIRLYKKYIGKEIYVKLFQKNEIGKEIIGILTKVDEQNNSISINVNDNVIEILLSNISSAHTTYDYDAKLKENKVNLNELKRF